MFTVFEGLQLTTTKEKILLRRILNQMSGQRTDQNTSALYEDRKQVLKGAKVITRAPEGGNFEIFLVPVFDIRELHPPTEAE